MSLDSICISCYWCLIFCFFVVKLTNNNKNNNNNNNNNEIKL